MNKKSIVNVIVSASLAATLGLGAFALTGCSAPEEQTPEAVEVQEDAYEVNVAAEGWDAETSTPAVLAFQKVDGTQFRFGDLVFDSIEELEAWASSDEGRDASGDVFEEDRKVGDPLYFAVACNEDVELDVDEGTYAVSVVTPINADGSIYATPETAHVDVSDASYVKPFELTLVKAEDAAPEQITSTIEALTLVNAVDPETVTEDVLERARANAGANPNVTAEEVKAAESAATEAASSGDAASAAGSAVSNATSTTSPAPSQGQSIAGNQGSTAPSTPAPSQGGSTGTTNNTGTTGGSTGGNQQTTAPSQPSQPAHTHGYTIPITEQVWVPGNDIVVCSCGKTFANTTEWSDHKMQLMEEGGPSATNGHSYSVNDNGHYETKTVGYKCSCGAVQ